MIGDAGAVYSMAKAAVGLHKIGAVAGFNLEVSS